MKVLVGCPTDEEKAYCLKEYARTVKRFDFPSYDVLLIDTSETDDYMQLIHQQDLSVVKGPYSDKPVQRLTDARNMLAKMAIDGKYDYLLFLEQHVLPKRDALRQLIAADKDVIAGVYGTPEPQAWEYCTPEDYTYMKAHKEEFADDPELYMLLDKHKDFSIIHEKVRKPLSDSKELRRIKAAGLGCLLIKTDILKRVPFRVASGSAQAFCEDLEDLQIPLFIHPGVVCSTVLKNNTAVPLVSSTISST